MQEKTSSSKSAILLIFLCFSVYFVAYLGRYSYSSNINCIIDYYNVNKANAGTVGTFFFIAYGVGQVVNGLLCKKYNPRYAISLALIISSFMNFFVGITSTDSFNVLKFYWLINGFAQSVLWSSLIRLLNESLPSNKLNTAIFVMGLPVSIGTFAIYGLSSLISGFNISFKIVFYISSVLLLVIGILWFMVVNNLKKRCIEEKEELNVVTRLESASSNLTKAFIIIFIVLAIFAISNNFVKDGLTTWMPTILKEKYSLDNSISTFLTVFLPFFAVFGSTFAIFLNKKLNNYIYVCGILYLIAFVMFLIVLLTLNYNSWILPLIAFMVVACAMSGVNNVLTNIFPMLYSKENAGTIAGVLDGFCYVGSAITAFGMGSIADNYGWNTVFYVLLFVCLLMIIICALYVIISKFKQAHIDKN